MRNSPYVSPGYRPETPLEWNFETTSSPLADHHHCDERATTMDIALSIINSTVRSRSPSARNGDNRMATIMTTAVLTATLLVSALGPAGSSSAAADQNGQPALPTRPPAGAAATVTGLTGTGCPADATHTTTETGGGRITTTFDRYTAQVGPQVAATEARKSCQITLGVEVPARYRFSVTQWDLRGTARMEKGATAVEQASLYFAGQVPTAFSSHSLSGPVDGSWQFTEVNDLANLQYSGCGTHADLYVSTALQISGGSSDTAKATSLIAMGPIVVDISSFAWQPC